MRPNFLTKLCLVWGVFWGILSFAIYFLGLLKFWYYPVLWSVFGVSIIVLSLILQKYRFFKEAKSFLIRIPAIFAKNKLLAVPLLIFFFLAALNLVGALAPEKEFDALWYHLTIPKIYLLDHSVHFIPGNLFYYSVMPRLAEMLYGLMLSFNSSGILAKILHFSFGLFWYLFSFQIFRLYFSRLLSLWLALIIYGLLIVSHLSSTAYIDLIVSFYAAGAIWAFLNYIKTDRKKYLYWIAIFLGLGLASKLYTVFLICAIGLVILVRAINHKKIANLAVPIIIILAIPMVYFLNAYLATGNPVFPVFSIRDSAFDLWIRGASTYQEWLWRIWPTKVFALFWWAMVYAFTPVFGLIFLLPLIKKRAYENFWAILACFLIFFVLWSFLPVWEPRYLMVILPLMAILAGFVIENFWKVSFFRYPLIVLIIIGLSYNFFLSFKNLEAPLSLAAGKISRPDYIKIYISDVWYNFYDVNDFFKNNLKTGEKILTVNFHNLFYIPVNFTDWSLVEKDIQSAEDLKNYLIKNQMRYIALNKVEKTVWPNFSKSDLDKFFQISFEDSERRYYVIK